MLLRFQPWKVLLLVGALLAGALMSLPNLVTAGLVPAKYLSWVPTGPVKLGLDLRGGASILLEIDPDDLRKNRLTILRRDISAALQQRPLIARDGQPEITSTQVIVKLRNPDAQKMTDAIARITKLGAPPVGTIGGKNSLIVTQQGPATITVELTQDALTKLQTEALTNSMDAVDRRVNNSGVVEPNIQRQGENRIVVEVPGLDDPAPLVDVLTQAGVLTFNLVDESVNPADYPADGTEFNGRRLLPNDGDGGQNVILSDPIITGQDLANASQGFDQSNRPNINFQLRGSGAQKFGKETTNNVGRRFAIVLDDRIVSAPNIRSPITGGSGVIEGSFTLQEAENLAIVLRSGALPAKLKVADRRTVGAGLGEDSIKAGVAASILGVILITIFMLVAYGLLGIFAVAALYLNLVLMLGVLSGFGATLTLPGIAGLLLTIGMAVDYNVLIFERIREEKTAGRSVITSVEAGYDHAMATIIDANVTHLVAASVMFMLGSGPVKGFALTLAIGVLTSMFTAVVVARWFTSLWLKYARPKYIPI